MNDERPIEKLLRRFAQKRREDAAVPIELHPVNRRLLQDEVAKQFPKAERRASWWQQISGLLNRRLAYATALVAVLAAGMYLIQLSNPKRDAVSMIALNEKKAASPVGADSQPAPPTVNPPAYLADLETKPATPAVRPEADSLTAQTESLAFDTRGKTVLAGTRTAVEANSSFSLESPPRSESTATDRVTSRRLQVSESVAKFEEPYAAQSATPASSPVSAASSDSRARPAPFPGTAISGPPAGSAGGEGFARRYGKGDAPASVTTMAQSQFTNQSAFTSAGISGAVQATGNKAAQNYSQVFDAGKLETDRPAKDAAPVLVNFVVEQDGETIRLTDSDGSTYTGRVQLAGDEDLRGKDFIPRGGGVEKSTNARTRYDAVMQAAQATATPSNQNVFFRVSGTNRTLKLQVNFVGNFVVLTNQYSLSSAPAQFADKDQAAFKQQSFAPLLQNSSIQGRLQVGGGREMELNALPVK